MARDGNASAHLAAVERIVRRGATYLGEALFNYWPAASPKHDMLERNISMHVARAFSENGFQVYTEVPWPDSEEEKKRLDLLAIDPARGIDVRVEAKRLFDANEIAALKEDLDRMPTFRVNAEAGSTRHFGVLVGTTWDEEIAQWWAAKDGRCLREGTHWRALYDHPLLKSAWTGCCVLHAYDDGTEIARTDFHYLLYGVFEIEDGGDVA